MDELAKVLDIKKTTLEKENQNLMKKLTSDKRTLLCASPGFVLVVYLISPLRKVVLAYPFNEALSNPIATAYTALVGFLVLYLILASAYLMSEGILFLRRITKFPVKMKFLQVGKRVRFTKLNNFIILATLGWYVGASLTLTVRFLTSNLELLGFLFFVIAFGLFFFFAPEYFLHESIVASKEELLSQIEAEFSSKTKLPIPPGHNSAEALLLCTMFERASEVKEWAFETDHLIQMLTSTVIPIGTVVLEILLRP
ncbi:MAG TPA: hypothetical protein VK487_04670 [Candidatus Bathyarchaeia archaeon]|nr:hypothetical protein [Candidatus Bathyarchaeia archaeon]